MVVFRLLNSIRKHHLALRYAGRHLFWTAPALYGYWTLAAQTRASYQDGPLYFARAVREYLRDEKEKTSKLRQQREELRNQQQQQQQSPPQNVGDGDCCPRRQRQMDEREKMVQKINRLGACGL
ncbi:hypothetical protein PGQ11_001865 [Apiospora arundinis]|uniref:Uncharacterized protein n=1 Tax=Apiospora arundinis TaxID=335852 RepID=A0ABR2JGD9_9PEZI